MEGEKEGRKDLASPCLARTPWGKTGRKIPVICQRVGSAFGFHSNSSLLSVISGCLACAQTSTRPSPHVFSCLNHELSEAAARSLGIEHSTEDTVSTRDRCADDGKVKPRFQDVNREHAEHADGVPFVLAKDHHPHN